MHKCRIPKFLFNPLRSSMIVPLDQKVTQNVLEFNFRMGLLYAKMTENFVKQLSVNLLPMIVGHWAAA